MGILNATPDSFHSESRVTVATAVNTARRMAEEGADMIDIGAQSTRPGAETVGAAREWDRLQPVLEGVRAALPNLPLSVDTFHAAVAQQAIQSGADMVNDISAGTMDPEMGNVVAASGVPYAIMHMQGTPRTMQDQPQYANVVDEVKAFLEGRLAWAADLGIQHLMVDPGFGFGKRLSDNYALLNALSALRILGVPILAGVSRKSMIYKALGSTPEQALNGTSCCHAWALDRGAHVLRVHDVAPAVECIALHQYLRGAEPEPQHD